MSEYVNDIFAYLYHLEEKYAIREDHLSGQRDVFPKMRSVLIDWINEVHLQYRFAQETFHMAVSIIDRYLQVGLSADIRLSNNQYCVLYFNNELNACILLIFVFAQHSRRLWRLHRDKIYS